MQAAAPGGWPALQERVEEVEELLHDSILAQIVMTRLHQLPMSLPLAVQAFYQLWPIDTTDKFDLARRTDVNVSS